MGPLFITLGAAQTQTQVLVPIRKVSSPYRCFCLYFHLCKLRANLTRGFVNTKEASHIRNRQLILLNWWRQKPHDESLCSKFSLWPSGSSLQSVGGRASCFRDTPICSEVDEGSLYYTSLCSAGTFMPLQTSLMSLALL